MLGKTLLILCCLLLGTMGIQPLHTHRASIHNFRFLQKNATSNATNSPYDLLTFAKEDCDTACKATVVIGLVSGVSIVVVIVVMYLKAKKTKERIKRTAKPTKSEPTVTEHEQPHAV